MIAHEYLKGLKYLPINAETLLKRPSNSTLRRWLDRGSVIINNSTPKWNEEIKFPINKLVFFSKGNKVTML